MSFSGIAYTILMCFCFSCIVQNMVALAVISGAIAHLFLIVAVGHNIILEERISELENKLNGEDDSQ